MSEIKDPLEGKVVINTLGSLSDPNDPGFAAVGSASYVPTLSRRVIDDALRAGVTAIHHTVGHVTGDFDGYEPTRAQIARWEEIFAQYPDELIAVRTAGDIEHAQRERKLGVIHGFQNSEMLGTDVDRIDEFADAGVRVIQLTYNSQNRVGAGALADDTLGLTEFGRNVVSRLNKMRVVVDLSHSNRSTCLDAIEASSAPVAITHTGCRALADLPRNKTDNELRKLADRGGYVGIYLMSYLAAGREATGDDVIAHIEHAVHTCGEDHVGIGTDMSFTPHDDIGEAKRLYRTIIEHRQKIGVSAPGEDPAFLPFVTDIGGVEQMRELARRLERRGHSGHRIEKLLGGNFLRFAREVWGA